MGPAPHVGSDPRAFSRPPERPSVARRSVAAFSEGEMGLEVSYADRECPEARGKRREFQSRGTRLTRLPTRVWVRWVGVTGRYAKKPVRAAGHWETGNDELSSRVVIRRQTHSPDPVRISQICRSGMRVAVMDAPFGRSGVLLVPPPPRVAGGGAGEEEVGGGGYGWCLWMVGGHLGVRKTRLPCP